ncbi:MAG TPA: mechanosensitive ion channel family protein [Rhodanobacteraceae bacterium]
MTYWLQHGEWLGNTTLAWIIAAASALLGYAILHGAATLIGAHLARLYARTHRAAIAVAADVVAATRGWLLLLIAIVVALHFLHLGLRGTEDTSGQRWITMLIYTLVGVQVALWATTLLVSWLNHSAARSDRRTANPVMVGVLKWAVQFVVWVTLLLALMAEGGVNITAFVASLGVGGVAVALALQNVLTDLFSSIAIGLDKPFEVGEYIAFDADQGTVLKVGIKSTRIKSLSGEELAVSNSVLLKNLIHNYSRMQERRIEFGFRVPYNASHAQLEALLAGTRAAITREEHVRFDRGHLRTFTEDGFELRFVYSVLDSNYTLYCDIQQRINLAIVDLLGTLGVDFAVPVRALRGRGADGASTLPPAAP